MKMSIFKIFINALLMLFTFASNAQQNFNVKNFGAIGDGKTDVTGAFQSCFNKASSGNSDVVIIIPKGEYLISKTIKFAIKDKQILVIRGEMGSTIVNKGKPINMILVEGDKDNPSSKLTIENLTFQQNNSSYSTSRPYYNTIVKGSAANIFNIGEVILQNNIVKNIYGDGFMIKNMNYTKCPINKRTKILVRNNKILNVWGQKTAQTKGLWGYYGDGITLNNVHNSEISNNVIINDLNYSRQFGRAGIVAEFNCENIVFTNNTIGGYEAAIHLEADFGGHTINNNVFKSSEMGIFAFVSVTEIKRDLPLTIMNNTFTNRGIPKKLTLSRLRSKSERGLISIITRGDFRKQSKISNNKFYVDNKYQFNSDRQMLIFSKNIILEDNEFKNLNFDSSVHKPVISIKNGIMKNYNQKYFNVKLEK